MPNEQRPRRKPPRPRGMSYTIGPNRRLKIGDIVIASLKRSEVFVDGIPAKNIAIENVNPTKLEFKADPALSAN